MPDASPPRHDVGQTPRQMMGGERILTGDVAQRHLGEGVHEICRLRHGSSSARGLHITRNQCGSVIPLPTLRPVDCPSSTTCSPLPRTPSIPRGASVG